jgi:hypothetical protein
MTIMLTLKIDKDDCVPNRTTPLPAIVGSVTPFSAFLQANEAAYTAACGSSGANRLMTFGTLPSWVTRTNYALAIDPTAYGTFTYTITWTNAPIGSS